METRKKSQEKGPRDLHNRRGGQKGKSRRGSEAWRCRHEKRLGSGGEYRERNGTPAVVGSELPQQSAPQSKREKGVRGPENKLVGGGRRKKREGSLGKGRGAEKRQRLLGGVEGKKEGRRENGRGDPLTSGGAKVGGGGKGSQMPIGGERVKTPLASRKGTIKKKKGLLSPKREPHKMSSSDQ